MVSWKIWLIKDVSEKGGRKERESELKWWYVRGDSYTAMAAFKQSVRTKWQKRCLREREGLLMASNQLTEQPSNPSTPRKTERTWHSSLLRVFFSERNEVNSQWKPENRLHTTKRKVTSLELRQLLSSRCQRIFGQCRFSSLALLCLSFHLSMCECGVCVMCICVSSHRSAPHRNQSIGYVARIFEYHKSQNRPTCIE